METSGLRARADVLISRKIDAVVHCAAASLVGESMANPSKYWRNNVQEAIGLLDAMVLAGVDKIVFSSSAAVYGEPVAVPIEETHPKSPTSTYGMTKLAIEHMLQSYSAAHSMRCVSLRYFNAAGADEPGDIGEAHNPETHLIPIVLQAALEQRAEVRVFVPTTIPDGTCVRDYIHVSDRPTPTCWRCKGCTRWRCQPGGTSGSVQPGQRNRVHSAPGDRVCP